MEIDDRHLPTICHTVPGSMDALSLMDIPLPGPESDFDDPFVNILQVIEAEDKWYTRQIMLDTAVVEP